MYPTMKHLAMYTPSTKSLHQKVATPECRDEGKSRRIEAQLRVVERSNTAVKGNESPTRSLCCCYRTVRSCDYEVGRTSTCCSHKIVSVADSQRTTRHWYECLYLICGILPSMAVVAASLQTFQTESAVTLKQQLQAEADQGPASSCSSCLGPRAFATCVRRADVSGLESFTVRKLRTPRLGGGWKLLRYSACGQRADFAEIGNEGSEASATEILSAEDTWTSIAKASGEVEEETAGGSFRAGASKSLQDFYKPAQLRDEMNESRRRIEPGSCSDESAVSHQQIDVCSPRNHLSDSVETHSPLMHSDGGSLDAGGMAEISSDIQTASDTDEKRELDPHRIYVGGIAFNFQGQELRKALRQLFSQFGPIRSLEVAVFGQDNTYVQENGRHRGFAYVVMEDPEDAKAAITCLNGQYYWGRHLMVRQAYRKVEERNLPDRPCQLYVGNLNKTITNRELRKIFKRFGHVIQTKVIKEYITGKSRGFAFVTFAEEREGKRAVQHMHGYVLGDSALVVNISKEPRITGADDVPRDAYSLVPSPQE